MRNHGLDEYATFIADRGLKREIKEFLGSGTTQAERATANMKINAAARDMGSISRYDEDPLAPHIKKHGRAAVALCIAATIEDMHERIGNWEYRWAMDVLKAWTWRGGNRRGVIHTQGNPTLHEIWMRPFIEANKAA